MSLPPLPDIFGNYALGNFNEVVSPAAIDWLPQTPGWYVVGAIVLILLSRQTWYRLQHWYRNRYRGEARQQLSQLSHSDALVTEVNHLLKLTALAAFTRQQVASLSGQQWTSFLNGQCEQAPFDETLCQLLGTGVYEGQAVDASAAEQLLQASLNWVKHHRNRYDD
ncbi:MAG: DUF4381 domain-containing protein [Halioglobus sp.]